MAQRRGFFERGGGKRWNPKKPYHVALEDIYVRENWFGIDVICKLNSLPFNSTGEKIQRDGTWCVFEFAWQMDAILFWHRFQGRWLRGDEFHLKTCHGTPMTNGGPSDSRHGPCGSAPRHRPNMWKSAEHNTQSHVLTLASFIQGGGIQ
jgi:hypothetical protein